MMTVMILRQKPLHQLPRLPRLHLTPTSPLLHRHRLHHRGLRSRVNRRKPNRIQTHLLPRMVPRSRARTLPWMTTRSRLRTRRPPPWTTCTSWSRGGRWDGDWLDAWRSAAWLFDKRTGGSDEKKEIIANLLRRFTRPRWPGMPRDFPCRPLTIDAGGAEGQKCIACSALSMFVMQTVLGLAYGAPSLLDNAAVMHRLHHKLCRQLLIS